MLASSASSATAAKMAECETDVSSRLRREWLLGLGQMYEACGVEIFVGDAYDEHAYFKHALARQVLARGYMSEQILVADEAIDVVLPVLGRWTIEPCQQVAADIDAHGRPGIAHEEREGTEGDIDGLRFDREGQLFLQSNTSEWLISMGARYSAASGP